MAHASPRNFASVLGGIASAAALALLPKCPLCLAAWLTVVTGISWSYPVAVALRYGMLAAAIGALLFALWTVMRQRLRHLSV